jgi:hypothetical protein
MKFVKTITWKIFNWDQLSHCDFKNDEKNIYPHFFLKNGEKFDAFDPPNVFTLEENGQKYRFCSKCCIVYFELLLTKINENFSGNGCFFDIEEYEDELWDEFCEWAKTEKNLEKYLKPVLLF